jgi:hypothetical protein
MLKKYKNGKSHTEYIKEYRLTQSSESKLLAYAKDRAKRKGQEFNIDKTDIDIPVFCPILGIPIYSEPKNKPSGPCPNSPSLDRIDNTKGYIKGNVKVISHKANTMKHNASPSELIRFAKWILYIYES